MTYWWLGLVHRFKQYRMGYQHIFCGVSQKIKEYHSESIAYNVRLSAHAGSIGRAGTDCASNELRKCLRLPCGQPMWEVRRCSGAALPCAGQAAARTG